VWFVALAFIAQPLIENMAARDENCAVTKTAHENEIAALFQCDFRNPAEGALFQTAGAKLYNKLIVFR
jgi:hypothetical protein